MKRIFIFLVSVIFSELTFSQELIQIVDETLTVNSTTNMTGITRNITKATLPEKCKGYIFRITISPKGESAPGEALFDLLENYGAANISLGASFARFAVKNNDNNAVDVFIFNNTYDADDFYAKADDKWGACRSMPNRVNCCLSSSDCIGRTVSFGFRNNNIMQGLDVHLEVVALIDPSSETDYKYPYSILNATGREIKYYISVDQDEWQEVNLRDSYKSTYSLDYDEIYFKVITDASRVAAYKIKSGERYKLIWSESKSRWDIIKY